MKTLIAAVATSGVLIALPIFAVKAQQADLPVEASVVSGDRYSSVSKRLAERVGKGDAPGFSVAVVKDGKIVWEQGTGWADREAGTPFTAATPLALASISKSITAAGIDALSAKGRIDPGSRVSGYLGEKWISSASAGKIKISHLLDQTSGIPHLFQYEFRDDPGSIFDRRSGIARFGFVAAEPGSRFLYTNLGYSILAELIAKAGGGGFEEVLSRELFAPLGMTGTGLSGWLGSKGYAKGYGRDGSQLEFEFRLAPDGGAGFISNAHDLALYSMFQLGANVPKGMERVPIAEYLKKHHRDSGFSYDRGWGIIRDGDTTFLISDGQMSGSSTAIVLVPEMRLAVVVLCNRTGGPALEVAGEILEASTPGLGKRFGAAMEKAEKLVAEPSELPHRLYEGHILKEGGRIPIRITFEGEKASLSIRNAEVEMRNAGWDRGSLQLIAMTGLDGSRGEDEIRRLVFYVWPEGEKLEGLALDELYNDRPRRGFPYKVELKRKK